ncbi:hypothetical protein AA313_de0209862 [Arthrobotrys entomopaga]|nr:hypothetical protein AA313_de0209862 [Arthrobotrys entomopaga]
MARSALRMKNAKVEENEASPFKKRTFKKYMARRWCIYLIISSIILTILFTLLLIFVIIPKIAQKSIDDATVEIHGITLRGLTNDYITVDMDSKVQASSPVPARLAPQTFKMFSVPSDSGQLMQSIIPPNEAPIMGIPIGELVVKGPTDLIVSGAASEILDASALNDFSAHVMNNSFVQFAIQSKSDLFLGGLNGLQGITASDGQIIEPAMSDGTNLQLMSTIPNPSVFTLELGDLSGDVYLSAIKLGSGVMRNAKIAPGLNKLPVQCQINPLLTMIPTITSKFLSVPNVKLKMMFTSVVSNGQHISWMEQSLRALPPTVVIMNPDSGTQPADHDAIENFLSDALNKMMG